MHIYILIGIGFYVGMALARQNTYSGSSLAGVIRGFLFGVLLWPIAAVVVWYQKKYGKSQS